MTFLDAIKDGLSIASCISRVQDQVLHKVSGTMGPRTSRHQVPNERNKFFIKFVFDNQLQVD